MDLTPVGKDVRYSTALKLQQRLLTGIVVSGVGIITCVVIIVNALIVGATLHGGDLTKGNATPGAADRVLFMASWGTVGGFFAGFAIAFPKKGEWIFPPGSLKAVLLADTVFTAAIGIANLFLWRGQAPFLGQDAYTTALVSVVLGIGFGAMGWFWFLMRMGRVG